MECSTFVPLCPVWNAVHLYRYAPYGFIVLPRLLLPPCFRARGFSRESLSAAMHGCMITTPCNRGLCAVLEGAKGWWLCRMCDARPADLAGCFISYLSFGCSVSRIQVLQWRS